MAVPVLDLVIMGLDRDPLEVDSCSAEVLTVLCGITVKCWRLCLTVPESVSTIYDLGVSAVDITFPRFLRASVFTHIYKFIIRDWR